MLLSRKWENGTKYIWEIKTKIIIKTEWMRWPMNKYFSIACWFEFLLSWVILKRLSELDMDGLGCLPTYTLPILLFTLNYLTLSQFSWESMTFHRFVFRSIDSHQINVAFALRSCQHTTLSDSSLTKIKRGWNECTFVSFLPIWFLIEVFKTWRIAWLVFYFFLRDSDE